MAPAVGGSQPPWRRDGAGRREPARRPENQAGSHQKVGGKREIAHVTITSGCTIFDIIFGVIFDLDLCVQGNMQR
jgi:hypothetical protein